MVTNFQFDSDRVKALRYRLGLTQKDFAVVLGVSLGTVAAWETGHQSPRQGPLVKRLVDAERAAEEAAGVA